MTYSAALGMAAMLNLAGGDWLVISDDVMGGRSTGATIATTQGIVFKGTLSLENNGGFSSTRRMVLKSPADARGVRLRVKGDGRTYQVRLRHDRNFDGISWRARFETSGDWQDIELPFADFEPVFRGYRVADAGSVRPGSISQVGLLLADKQAGAFNLEVTTLEFVR